MCIQKAFFIPCPLFYSLVQQFSKKWWVDARMSPLDHFFILKNILSFQISLYLNIKIEKWVSIRRMLISMQPIQNLV